MGFAELILFVAYVLFFHGLFMLKRRRMKDELLKKYHRRGFVLRIFSTVLFTIFFVYLTPGDSTSLYYPEGRHLAALIFQDPLNYIPILFQAGKDFNESLLFNADNAGYLRADSNFIIVKLVALLSFISFGKYLIINLFFCMMAYSGLWRLYLFFYAHFPQLHQKLALAILYLPTLIFWSSGILKDTICMGLLGWMTYAIFLLFNKRTSKIKYLLLFLAAAYGLHIIKAYILLAYLPFFGLFLLMRFLKKIPQKGRRRLAHLVTITLALVAMVAIAQRLEEELGNLALNKITQSIKTQQANFLNMANQAGSSFTLGVEYDGSLQSLIRLSPAAIGTTFFRPFLWESKKISTIFSSIESLALMCFTLFVFIKLGPLQFFRTLFTNEMVFFCFFYALIFALFVGATTLNFGTLVRYKIPCLPFFIIALFVMLDVHYKKIQDLNRLKKLALLD